MAGICRGAQLLNSMMGGELWQEVKGHKVPHQVYSLRDAKAFTCSSTHHQMMTAPPTVSDGPRANVLLLANRSTDKTRASRHTGLPIQVFIKPDFTLAALKEGGDVEAIVYPDEKILCVQGHPEHGGFGIFTEWYMENLARYLGVKHGGS